MKEQKKLLKKQEKEAQADKAKAIQDSVRQATDDLFRIYGRAGALGGTITQAPILGGMKV